MRPWAAHLYSYYPRFPSVRRALFTTYRTPACAGWALSHSDVALRTQPVGGDLVPQPGELLLQSFMLLATAFCTYRSGAVHRVPSSSCRGEGSSFN